MVGKGCMLKTNFLCFLRGKDWLEFLYFGVTLFCPIRRGFSCAAPTCLYKSSDRTGCASNWHSRLLGIVPANLENREEHFTVSADLKANYFFLAFPPSRVKDHQLVLRTKAKENPLHISFIWLRTLKSSNLWENWGPWGFFSSEKPRTIFPYFVRNLAPTRFSYESPRSLPEDDGGTR